MFTPATQKARSRSRRKASRWTAKAAEPAVEDDLPEAYDIPDAIEFETDDTFVLGDDDVFTTFAGNVTPLAAAAPAHAATDHDDDAPFDAPEEDDEIFQERRVIEALEPEQDELLLTVPTSALRPPASAPSDAPALPALRIYASWDTSEIAEQVFSKLASDPRARRAKIEIDRGGLEGAGKFVDDGGRAGLLLIESTLKGRDMLRALDRLAPAVEQGARIVLLGGVNDISLLRELAARGVSEYIVPPITPEALVGQLCRLHAADDNAHVIAVIGARGGIGASTLAQNIAWSIAERQQQDAAIVDLDLPFGTTALNFRQHPTRSIGEAFASASAEQMPIDDVAIRPTPRLQIYSAPASLEAESKLNGERLAQVLTQVRRTSGQVVLDLPHVWSAWVQETLLRADDIVIVTGPDLASLSSAKSMLEALKEARANVAPHVVLSMVGIPKRPEIASKDFAAALGAQPVLALPFDPQLFGGAAMGGKMIGEFAPESKIAASLDELAAMLTGFEPVAQRAKSIAVETLAPVTQAPSAQDDGTTKGALRRLRCAYAQSATPDAMILRARNTVKGRRPPPPTSNLLRATAALTALFVVGAWHMQSQRASAVTLAAPPTPAPVAAAAAPDPAQIFQAALQRLSAGEATEAATVLQTLAARDYAPAQYRLAKLYETGDGVAANLETALLWTERAANAGEARAMHDLGVYYARGEVVPADPVTAFRWFKQAAERGIADSQYNLGVLYEQGRGVSADPAEALFWFTVAARQGDAAAAERALQLAPRIAVMVAEQQRVRAEAFSPRA